MYLSYDEYLGMGGTLDDDAFRKLEFQAEAHINYVTFNRLKADKEIPLEVTRLTFYLVDLMEKRASAFSLGKDSSGSSPAAITSQSNDGVSISYSGMSPSDLIKLCEKDSVDTIRFYLEGVTNAAGRKLLYRGLYPGE